ncbi:hypothetical protein RHGRI_004055 [Rhododendron griersonianum]|uniref:Rx N-terminal domain-containing protein n=1 Tax=Rhododendron griersonianum TaxID=479676 RepID=A0AAV6L948_9ERIC|nr:hypothetical protein RHGRI_004055 [Rhododendron griersonianum]
MSLVFTTNSRSDDHPQPRQLRRPTPPLQPSLRRKNFQVFVFLWQIQRNVYAVEVVFKYAICSGRFGPLGEPLPTNSGVLHYVSSLGVKCFGQGLWGNLCPPKVEFFITKIDVMAHEAVSSAINSTLFSSEVKLLWNIHSEVSSIKDELESIMSFLKKADSSAELENEGAKVWVKQVRAVAYQIEDVMDEYILHLAENRQRCGFLCFLQELARSITELKLRHDLASQIKDIKQTIRDIKERADSTKSRIRSVFVFSVGELPKQQLLGTLAGNFKLVKVLDLQGAPLDQLNEEVGNLLHLRYLSVKGTNVEIIPKSIGNLHNLQTLNLKDSKVSVLQIGILSRLRKLRHLIGPYRVRNYGVEIQGGIGHLEELQTLKTIMANDDLIKELENLRQLRKLTIMDVKSEHVKALYTAIEKMNHLQSLEVWFIQGDTILDLHSLSSPPKSLQCLYSNGHLEMLPNWISRLDNLVSLDLLNSWLTGAHAIKALQALPNLIQLNFYRGYDGEQLYSDVGGFRKLKRLYLQSLGRLNSVIIEEGGLPVLEKLGITACPQLKEVPSGIRNLTKLKSLSIILMPTEFYDRMRPDKGQDYWVIEHIPDVKFIWKDGQGNRGIHTPREFQDVRESLRVNDESQEVLLPTHEVKEIHVQDNKEFQEFQSTTNIMMNAFRLPMFLIFFVV